MFNLIKQVFKGAVIKEVNSGIYDGAVRWKSISINGEEIKQKFNSYPSDKTVSGFTSFYRKNLILAADDLPYDGKIKVKGKVFELKEKEGKNGKYLAIYDGKYYRGNYFKQSNSCYFKNICL